MSFNDRAKQLHNYEVDGFHYYEVTVHKYEVQRVRKYENKIHNFFEFRILE